MPRKRTAVEGATMSDRLRNLVASLLQIRETLAFTIFLVGTDRRCRRSARPL
jgi:hypothetical protein